MGLRVSQAEEIEGLDIGEHGMEAYAGFQTTTSDYVSMNAAVTTSAPAGVLSKSPHRV
jgi:hypothetical protein